MYCKLCFSCNQLFFERFSRENFKSIYSEYVLKVLFQIHEAPKFHLKGDRFHLKGDDVIFLFSGKLLQRALHRALKCVCFFLLPIRDPPRMPKMLSIITSTFLNSNFCATTSLNSSIKFSSNTSLIGMTIQSKNGGS